MMVLLFVKTDELRFDIGILPMAASALIMAADVALNKTNPIHLIMKVDWNVILMFFGIFVWLGGVNATRVPRYVWKAIGLAGRPIDDAKSIAIFAVFVIFGSNVFSNVPLTIIILEQLQPCANQLDLVLYLAWCSTIAGNLTLFGSVANIIVAQKAKQTLNIPLTFGAFFKYGFLTTLIITIQGIFVIYGLLQI
ncbi:silicon efflux transporter LSI3-like [Haliotis rubra]|uniref:silicon efflux transporter LSI3-like n=1 Tax=Haliotis rubra TaxID=36100 RepID=UPI001EE55F7A|nr:silicon efflux transporter LSI3-like [Haliotis rubra]